MKMENIFNFEARFTVNMKRDLKSKNLKNFILQFKFLGRDGP